MGVQKIKKRNGTVVDFDAKKIAAAIEKAFRDVRGTAGVEKARAIADHVMANVETVFKDAVPGVENIQDFVERELMETGFFDVAKSYILYRYEHAKERAERKKELLEKIEKNDLMVIKRSGAHEPLSMDKLRRSFGYAVKGLEKEVNAEAVLAQCRSELYEGIKTADISRALIMTTRAMIEQDPAYAKVAARLLLFVNYKEVIGADIDYNNLQTQYRAAFIKNLKRGVEIGRLDPHLLAFDLETLSQALVIERDDLFVYMGLQTLYDRYFVSDHDKKQVLETPQMFWMRIAMGTAINEKRCGQQSFMTSCRNFYTPRQRQHFFMLEHQNHSFRRAI